MELYRRETEFSRKRLVGYIVLLSVGFYGFVVVFGYFYYFPQCWSEAVLRLLLFLLLPLVIFWAARFLINWLFALKQERNDQRAAHLRLRRQQLLEEVKAKETYKTAKEILEKFDPQIKMEAKMAEERKRHIAQPTAQGAPSQLLSASSKGNNNVGEAPNSLLRQRPQPAVRAVSEHNLATSELRSPTARDNFGPPSFGQSHQLAAEISQYQRPSLTPSIQLTAPARPPGPILPRDRSAVDKLVDYLLGDGPNNRYALICRQCHSHNGMSLREDFEFVAFRCCYCNAFNPARKQLPTNPGLSSSAGNLLHAKLRRDSDVSSPDSQQSGRDSPVDEIPAGTNEDVDDSSSKNEVEVIKGQGGTSYR